MYYRRRMMERSGPHGNSSSRVFRSSKFHLNIFKPRNALPHNYIWVIWFGFVFSPFEIILILCFPFLLLLLYRMTLSPLQNVLVPSLTSPIEKLMVLQSYSNCVYHSAEYNDNDVDTRFSSYHSVHNDNAAQESSSASHSVSLYHSIPPTYTSVICISIKFE